MPIADPAFNWQEALAAFAIITLAAFLVTWILTDRLRIPRAPYIPMLLAVTLGLGAGYLAWSGTSPSDLLASRVGWGLAAGLLAAAKVGSGALAILGAALVILVHHLGYAEFRAKAGRPGLFGALAVCGVQAIAFLVTGSVLAPIVAHIILHGQLLLRGDELPPAMPQKTALST